MMECEEKDVQKEGAEADSPPSVSDDSALGPAKLSTKPEGDPKPEAGEGQLKAFDNGALSQAECLKFRDNLFEVIEELRIRRVTDAENEERISQLVKEKHQLERTREEEAGATTELEKKHAQEITDLHKQYKEQIQQAEDCKNKSVLDLETSEREIKALKEEVQNLHMCKYSLEQKVKEQERQLKLQACAKDSHLSQLTDMEQKCSSLFLQCRQLTETQDRLEKSVTEAIRINKKLTSVNNHQTCLLKMHDSALEGQKREVQALKVQGHCKLNNSDVTASDEQNTIHLLQQELKIQQDLSAQFQLQLKEMVVEKTAVVSSLQEFQGLVDKHVETCGLLKQKLEVTELELQNLKTDYEGLKKSFDGQGQELQNLKDVHKDAFEKWKKQEESLQSRLKMLQEDYELLEKARNNLEELNTSWAKKNIKMTEEINSLTTKTKEFHKDTVTVSSQTQVSSTDTATQTDAQCESLFGNAKMEAPERSASNQLVHNVTTIIPMELDNCSEKMDTTDSSQTQDKEAVAHSSDNVALKGPDPQDNNEHKSVGNVAKGQSSVEIDPTNEVDMEETSIPSNTQKPTLEAKKGSCPSLMKQTTTINVKHMKADPVEAKESAKLTQGSKLEEEFERIDKVFQEPQEGKSTGGGSTTALNQGNSKCSSMEKDQSSSSAMTVGVPGDVTGSEVVSSSSDDCVPDSQEDTIPASQLDSGEATGLYQYKFVSLQENVPALHLHQEKHDEQQAPGDVQPSQVKSLSRRGKASRNEWEELAKNFGVES